MSNRLREQLSAELARAVRQAGLVIWQDEHQEYIGAAQSICPTDVPMVTFDGSWFGLRWEVEARLGGERAPELVIYAPASVPAEDPLAEIRAAGKEFKRRLATLIRQALDGQLAAVRIEQIAREARTLEEAEAAAGGTPPAEVRLVGILGTGDSVQMALAVLNASRDSSIDAERAWPDVSRMLSDAFGGLIAGERGELRELFAQQVLLTEISTAVGQLSDVLSDAWMAPTSEQRRRTQELLRVWRYAPEWSGTYHELATRIDARLGLSSALTWTDGLQTCFSAPAIEGLCMSEAVRRLEEGDQSGALVLAQERLLDANPWRDERASQSSSRWSDRWRVVKAIAELRRLVDANVIPNAGIAELLDWYVAKGYQVDGAHRRLELARGALASHGELEQHLTAARSGYEHWVDQLLRTTTAALTTDGLAGVDQLTQGEIHDRHIKDVEGPTAYVWVDALRYELGVELADAIRTDITQHVSIEAAIAGVPTITRVGMANLLPAAAEKLRETIDGGKLSVSVGERKVSTVEHRVELLRAAHGAVANLDLATVSQQGEKELSKVIKGASLVLVRSQEIDAAGESGLLNTAWPQFEATKQDLANAVAKLGQVGIRRVVISADHGFLAMSQSVGDPRTIDAPIGAEGELHRRAWVGKGGTTAEGTARVSLAALGIRSDLDVIVPRGLAVFKAGGGKQFFHGGLSPQELVIPVIVVDLEVTQETQKLDINVNIAGDRIATGVFAATVLFLGDLFTDTVTFRVVARGAASKEPVARVVSGDGYDSESGSVTVTQDKPAVLTFQVISNLERDAEVEVQVLDARTGRRLAGSVAKVAASVVVEDEL
ncbi:MAG: PglZ domain-containing protein [Fimbriimonadaceae bacterium]|nr:PglZ domain-containing protein [Fimbriimonadaceae bacterium]